MAGDLLYAVTCEMDGSLAIVEADSADEAVDIMASGYVEWEGYPVELVQMGVNIGGFSAHVATDAELSYHESEGALVLTREAQDFTVHHFEVTEDLFV